MPQSVESRQKAAVTRGEERAARTSQEQQAVLAKRPGKSVKESTRLLKELNK